MADDFTRRVFQRQQLILADRQLTTLGKMIAPDIFEVLIRAGAPREQITLYGRVE